MTIEKPKINSKFKDRLPEYLPLFNEDTSEFFVRESPEVVFEHLVNLLKKGNIPDFKSDDLF